MKLVFKISITFVTVIFLNACSKDDHIASKPISTSINKILPLGASRVEGGRPEYESYRYQLWSKLKENNWTFDFIGTQTDDANYPSVNSQQFDIDHEGRGGWTSGQILDEINEWLIETGTPDVVLFSSPGGNDALKSLPYQDAVDNINAIIDVLQANNPNVTIIIEQMAPGFSEIMSEELATFFNQMQQEVLNIAKNHTTSSSQVITVDMFSGFNDSMLADDVHYNDTGAQFIANKYYNVLEELLKVE
jgi:lysophospholipase L1-like esterase